MKQKFEFEKIKSSEKLLTSLIEKKEKTQNFKIRNENEDITAYLTK
jgi:hypothetical protein